MQNLSTANETNKGQEYFRLNTRLYSRSRKRLGTGHADYNSRTVHRHMVAMNLQWYMVVVQVQNKLVHLLVFRCGLS